MVKKEPGFGHAMISFEPLNHPARSTGKMRLLVCRIRLREEAMKKERKILMWVQKSGTSLFILVLFTAGMLIACPPITNAQQPARTAAATGRNRSGAR